MEIKEYLAELFADVLEDIIIQTFGDSTAERLKSIFSPDKRKRKRALIQAFKSAIENTSEISPELKEALRNREFAEDLLKYVLRGDFEKIKELARNYEISDMDDFVRDFENELRLQDEFREIIIEIRKTKDLDRITEDIGALKKQLVGEDPEKLRNEYFESIEKRYGYLDLKGFSPRIGRKEIVKIPLDDIFIPLKFVDEAKIDYSETRDGETRYGKTGAKIIGMDDLLGYDRCVILGDPGSGKTTLLKRFACETRSYIPIYVRITDYSEKMSQFSDLYSFVVNSDSKYKNLFKWAIENGKALILLDGLDEVIDVAHRMKVSEEIRKLLTSFLNNKYVVTSRLIGYESVRLAGFEHFIIQPFERKDIEHFAKRWYRAIAEESDKNFKDAEKNANELIEAIFRNKSIERLATNPLLMTIIALIHYRGKKLPNRRVELYQVCAETMLESWVLQRIPSEEYLKDKDALIEILSPVAFYIHATSPRGLIDEDTFMENMIDVMVSEQGIDKRSAKKEAKEIGRYLEEENGLFMEKGKEDGKSLYGFFHLSFQEYFAALELVDKWKKGQIDLNKYVFDSRWLEIVRLGAADLGSAAKRGRYEATEFVKAILNVEDDFEEAKRPLILAGYILSDDVKLEHAIENKIIGDLFNEYLNTDYDELRRSILVVIKELLSSEKDKGISERIKKLANSESVRAIDLLILIDVEEALPILSNLAVSKNVEVRRTVASNIRVISCGVRDTPKFIEILNNLIMDEDFITFFNIVVLLADKRELMEAVRVPDDFKESYNLKKSSLFLPYFFDPRSMIELDDLMKDEDNEIKKIANSIYKQQPYISSILNFYPVPTIKVNSDDVFSILATKQNYELDYLDFRKPINLIKAIETVKSTNLPGEYHIIKDLFAVNKELVIKNFEKIVNTFRHELAVLYTITGYGGTIFTQDKFDAYKFPETDDPVIRLLISDILKKETR